MERSSQTLTAELADNTEVNSLLAPDVTLPNGERGLSLGVGIQAVPAIFDLH